MSDQHSIEDCPNPKTWTVLDTNPDLGFVAGEIRTFCPCYIAEENFNREMTELVLEEWREGGWNDDY